MNRELKALLILKGIKQVDIANKLHLTRASVSMCVSGKSGSRRIRECIAKSLGKKAEELWPNENKAA